MLGTRHAEPAITNDFEWRTTPNGRALVCVALERYAPHLFTTREWPLGTAAERARAAAWAEVASAFGVDATHLVRAHQVHGTSVVVQRRGDAAPRGDAPLAQADILLSDDPSLVLAVQTADCVPLLMADRTTGAVAAAHAGWRGLASGVPRVTIDRLWQAFGTHPGDLVVAIGPSICAARYEVGEEVRQRFEDAGYAASQLARWFLPGARARHWQFDGWASVRDQLEAAGVPSAAIHGSGLCTAGDPELLCSYRRDGKQAGRIAAAIRSRGDSRGGAPSARE